MKKHETINYLEIPSTNLQLTKEFFSKVFNWTFTDYGPTYTAFSNSGLMGGFEKTENEIVNGALVVLYHSDLNLVKSKIMESKGVITKDIFSFPGGCRFHFKDPDGNELAVWSEQ